MRHLVWSAAAGKAKGRKLMVSNIKRPDRLLKLLLAPTAVHWMGPTPSRLIQRVPLRGLTPSPSNVSYPNKEDDQIERLFFCNISQKIRKRNIYDPLSKAMD